VPTMIRLHVAAMSLLLLAPVAAPAQEVQPKAMTREEIERELRLAAPVHGQVLYDGRLFCLLDSTSGVPARFHGTPARAWLEVGRQPQFTVRLQSASDLSRIHVERDGPSDSVAVIVSPTPGARTTYTIRFSRPLADGDYQFSISRGEMLLYPQCGFTVRGSRP
jgi:hypothetical protein